MSTANSPTYAQGRADGLADNERVRNGLGADGPQPPFPDYPVMYLKGYEETYNPAPAEEEAS
jgi:hypothetical protein